MSSIERKVVPFRARSVKNSDGDGVVSFAGYASTFGNEDLVGDIVVKGAFEESLKEAEPKMFWNHDAGMIPIGRWTKMEEDERGLYVEGELTAGHSIAEDVAAAMRHGTIDSMSIGYRTEKSETDEKTGVRQLTKLKLMEVSPVNFPANEQAAIVNVKSQIEAIKTARDMERWLRDAASLSASEAKAMVSRFKAVARDADHENETHDATDDLVGFIQNL